MSIFPEPVATASKRSNTPTDTREIDTAKRYRFRPPRDAVYNLSQNTNCPPRARIGKFAHESGSRAPTFKKPHQMVVP